MTKRHPFFQGLTPTLHIAHRGGAALAPENTLEAFRLAVEKYRTDMLELDVHVSRDGELMVAHDATLDRCTDGTGPLKALTADELSRLDAGFRFVRDDSIEDEDASPDDITLDGTATAGQLEEAERHPFRGRGVRIPRLVEVLRAFPSVRLNLELKEASPGAEQLLAELLRKESAVDRVCVGSADDGIGARLYQALPEGCHFYPELAGSQFVLSVRQEETPPPDERFSVLDLPLFFGEERVDSPALRAEAQRQGKWINYWTVDDAAEMRTLVASGVGGIMTDRPDLLRAVLSGK